MAKGVRAGRSLPTSVSSPRARPQMVLGSRPPDMYAPRIKPLQASTRSYGKQQPAGSDPAGAGFSPALNSGAKNGF